MIRRTQTSTDDPTPQWQTIYCSLMLLLVVFFVMLIAYSAIDTDRFLQKKTIEKAAQDVSMTAPDMNQAMQSLQQLAVTAGMSGNISVARTEDGIKAVVPNPVLFGSGDASLNESVHSILDGVIKIAQQHDLAIQVEGHTDNRPIKTAKYPSNWELSTIRAVNILRYFQDNGGMPPKRLAAVGFAAYHPVASNDTPEGRQQNRRIEIILRPGT
ncbi:MAG: OmpA family protein [Deltaproteobacteria bacterium]|nr:OmpA family protein [Deltaproteobacteria bacterium]